LIEATSTQSHHHFVHSVSLIPLLIPGLLPWNERIRVWNDLGSQLRMLHLLEHQEIMSRDLVMFLIPGADSLTWPPSHKDNGAIERAMLHALVSLRNYEEDRTLCIVSIALYSLSRFIFSDLLSISDTIAPPSPRDDVDGDHNDGETERGILLEGPRGRLLIELLEQNNESLLSDVLKWYSVVKRIEVHLQAHLLFSHSVTEISQQIWTIWKEVSEFREAAPDLDLDLTMEPNSEMNYSQVFVKRNGRKESLESLLKELQARK
jgi:hypothetical protein